jgi:hypothetical protein
MTQEQAVVGETGLGAEEGKPSRPVQFDQPGEEQAFAPCVNRRLVLPRYAEHPLSTALTRYSSEDIKA